MSSFRRTKALGKVPHTGELLKRVAPQGRELPKLATCSKHLLEALALNITFAQQIAECQKSTKKMRLLKACITSGILTCS